MKKIYFLPIVAAMLIPMGAAAQNLNPTVSVTRTYEGKLMDVHKPMETMAVADSMSRFDLDFDYSVFDNPYRGAYDFKPYELQMRPQDNPYTGRKIYFKAGAGYRLRPSVDFVWEPNLKTEKFKMDVFASHHSYIGKYRKMWFDDDFRLTTAADKERWNGYDMMSVAGFNGQADLNKATLAFDAGYEGIHTKDSQLASGYNGAEFSFRAKSSNPSESYLYFDVAMKYKGTVQGLGGLQMDDPFEAGVTHKTVGINDVDFNVTLGPVMNRDHRIVADFGMGMTWYGGGFKTNVGTAYVTPKYILERNRWRIAVGPKFSFNISDRDGSTALNTNKGTLIYPDANIGFELVRNYLNIYFKATGGDYRNQYSALKERSHFFMPYHGMSNNSVEQYNLALGLGGNIRSRFIFDVKAGFRSYEAMPFDVVYLNSYGETMSEMLSALAYLNGTAAYANLKFKWESRNLSIDSRFDIEKTMFKKSEKDAYFYFEPSKFSGFVNATYNWKKRIFAGVSAEFASKRDGRTLTKNFESETVGGETGWKLKSIMVNDSSIPAWVNLGVHAEFAFSRKMSFWVRGENLLDMNIQRVPLYTDGGIGFTAGICLNL